MTPWRLGPYRLETLLGRGAMGSVYRAAHLPTGAVRAVKVLEGIADPELVARFRREVTALARVGAEVALGVHEVGQHEGRLWIALDLVRPGNHMGIRARAFVGRARLQLRVGAAAEALALLDQAGHAFGDMGEIEIHACWALLRLGRLDDARRRAEPLRKNAELAGALAALDRAVAAAAPR